jgi:Flp pilus assembly protein TadG
MLKTLVRMRRDDRGANVVELALVSVLLLIMLAGAVDFGNAFYHYVVISNASREAARWASHFPWDEEGIQDAAIREAAGSGVEIARENILINGLGHVGGQSIWVGIEYPHTMFVGALTGIDSVMLRNGTEMIVFGVD